MLQKTIEEVYEDFLVNKYTYVDPEHSREIFKYLLDRGWTGFQRETNLDRLVSKFELWNAIDRFEANEFQFCNVDGLIKYKLVDYKNTLDFKQIVLENKIKFVDNVMILPEGFTYVLQNNTINIYEN